jgi:hypothetical protein
MSDREKLVEAMALAVRQSRVGAITPPDEPTNYDTRLATAALAAIEAQGAVIVPVEATDEMWDAGCAAHQACAPIYAAMLAANPYRKGKTDE